MEEVRESKAKQAGQRCGSVLAIGALLVDLVCRVPRLPQAGEGLVVQERRTSLGGCAYNSAVVARRLGTDCKLVAPVGEGVFADFAARELARQGFEPLRPDPTLGGAVPPLDCGACLCLIEPDGERTMLTLPGIERHFQPAWFDTVDGASASAAFVSGYELEGAGGDAILGFLERNPHLELYYAAGPRIADVSADKTARVNALRPVWHVNDQEALAYTGCATVEEAACALAREGGGVAVVTAGAQGAYLAQVTEGISEKKQGSVSVKAPGTAEAFVSGASTADGEAPTTHAEAFKPQTETVRCVLVPTRPVTPVDTVGAGDAHLGALVAARQQRFDWEEAVAFANRVAALACEVHGALLEGKDLEAAARELKELSLH